MGHAEELAFSWVREVGVQDQTAIENSGEEW